MEPNKDQSKQTPGRRRRGGKNANSSGRKNYASEGDVLADMPVPSGFPATPMKPNTATPAPGSLQAASKSTSRKNNRKPRPNNVSTSPGPTKPERRTPPHSAFAESKTAFAVSTYLHASPAPSDLPLPKFFRSKTDSSVTPGIQKELSPPASDCGSPSPSQPATLSKPKLHEESPLDLLFRADRAEKERAEKKRALSANSTSASSADPNGPFSPPSALHPPQNPQFSFDPIPLKLPSRPAQRGPSGNTGAPGQDSMPNAFAMPVHEQIRAARAAGLHSQQPSPPHMQGRNSQQHPLYQQQQQQFQQFHHEPATPPRLFDKSEEMKKLLGIGVASSPKSAPSPAENRATPSTVPFSNGVTQSAPQLSAVDNVSSPGNLDDRKFFAENELRKVLKLPISIGGGYDGSHSPQPQPGHYSRRA